MFREVIMGWKHISTLQQISVPLKEHVGECIDGIKNSKKLYVESLTTVIVYWPSDYNDK